MHSAGPIHGWGAEGGWGPMLVRRPCGGGVGSGTNSGVRMFVFVVVVITHIPHPLRGWTPVQRL